jgi:hypothetical protein
VISEFEVKQIGELRNELDNEFKERTTDRLLVVR